MSPFSVGMVMGEDHPAEVLEISLKFLSSLIEVRFQMLGCVFVPELSIVP